MSDGKFVSADFWWFKPSDAWRAGKVLQGPTTRAAVAQESTTTKAATAPWRLPDDLIREQLGIRVEYARLRAWCCLGEATYNPIPLYAISNHIVSLQNNQPVDLFRPAESDRVGSVIGLYGTADGKQVVFDQLQTDWRTISYTVSVLDISYDGGKPVAKHREVFRKSLPYSPENREKIEQFGSCLLDEGHLYVKESIWDEAGHPSTVYRINVNTGAVDVLAGLSDEIKEKANGMETKNRELRRCLHYVTDGVYRMEPVRSGPKYISTLDRLMKDGKPLSPAQWWLPLPMTGEASQGPTTQPGQ